jgi:uncharacterized alpha/beta hydrolase family protein
MVIKFRILYGGTVRYRITNILFQKKIKRRCEKLKRKYQLNKEDSIGYFVGPLLYPIG